MFRCKSQLATDELRNHVILRRVFEQTKMADSLRKQAEVMYVYMMCTINQSFIVWKWLNQVHVLHYPFFPPAISHSFDGERQLETPRRRLDDNIKTDVKLHDIKA